MAPPEEQFTAEGADKTGRRAGAAVGERRWEEARDEKLEAEIAETKAKLEELLARRNRADLAMLGPKPENDPSGVIEEASEALAEKENTDGNIGKPVSSVAASGGKKQRSKTRRRVGSRPFRPFKRTGKTKKDRRAQMLDGRS
ncbi:hypothetical protein FOZ63_014627 [Perkinsus olseni]|uniref:Uncharacterized protein n=1 Tax=Perkinsus olseni TaxID=32597 RepID=A0A7J6PDT3_PEROL|nr:hypothetical protein FOZ63_014627 [Perkinsus olseni]